MKSPQVQRCLDKAAYCERMAAIASDADARLQFAEVAKQWQHLAKQIEELKSGAADVAAKKALPGRAMKLSEVRRSPDEGQRRGAGLRRRSRVRLTG